MTKPLACGMALTLFLQLIIELFIVSDRLCLSVLIFCTVSAIGISVKSHIGTSLLTVQYHICSPKIPFDPHTQHVIYVHISSTTS